MVYESKRADILHQYKIDSESLKYSAGTRTQVEFAWKDLEKITPARGGALALRAKGHQPLVIWLEAQKMESFLKDLFYFWRQRDPESATRAAFDYGAAQNQTLAWVVLAVSLLFPSLLGAMLLTDAFNTKKCNALFAQNPKVVTAKLNKVAKNRRGNFIWSLEFTTAEGRKLKGTRTAYHFDPKGHPVGGEPTVLYAPEDAKCWDLSLRPGEPSPNWKQRSFTLLMTMSFGWVFAILGLLGCTWGLIRIFRRYPFAEPVRRIANELLGKAAGT
ncbi:MAG: hypothetical protein AB1540_01705 [Bdellovibrionota bacterium]